MQVVVTGATSFIGAATVKKLMEAGHQVFAVVRPASSNMKHLEKLAGGEADGLLTICPLDLADIRTLHGFLADAWIHIGWDAQSGMCSSAMSPTPWMRWRQQQPLAAAAFYLPDPRRSTESGTRLWQRTRPAIRCLNMARQRWIFAKKRKYFANRRIWSIFIRGYTACTVRGITHGLWFSPACAPFARVAA